MIMLYNYKVWIEEHDESILKDRLNSILTLSGYNILNFVEHHFFPFGYTSIWLLAESHLAIHTYPEYCRCYVELTGCSKIKNYKFVQLINDKFKCLEAINCNNTIEIKMDVL